MKKIIAASLVLVLLVCFFPQPVYASDMDTVYFADGSCLEITVHEDQSKSTGTKNGTKVYVYKNNAGEAKWQAVLNGTFTYSGTSASCTASSCNVTIYIDDWYVISKTTGKSGATATAELTMGYKVFGITAKKVPVSMSLTCDVNGKLS